MVAKFEKFYAFVSTIPRYCHKNPEVMPSEKINRDDIIESSNQNNFIKIA